MAIKDWRKTKSDKERIVYTTKGNSLIIEKEYHYWSVKLFRGNLYGLKNIKIFKTKPQAMKFAKAYMRKN